MPQSLSNLNLTDWFVIIIWVAAIIYTSATSLQLWAVLPNSKTISVVFDSKEFAIAPYTIFAGPLFLLVFPLMSQIFPRPGLPNIWTTPGKIAGFALVSIGLVTFFHTRLRLAIADQL